LTKATALPRPIVAIEPLSLYTKGFRFCGEIFSAIIEAT